MTRPSIPATLVALLALSLAAPLGAQQTAAAPKPWHLDAPHLASACRAAVDEMRRTMDAAVNRPLASQTFGNTLRPIEEGAGA